jgi:hypothetical protein
MDISFWTQCNPKIALEDTTKKFFGQYLYRMVVYAPASRLIRDKKPVAVCLEHAKNLTRNINAGYWGLRRDRNLNEADVDFLERLKSVAANKDLNVKLRAEEPYVQIYADSPERLEELVRNEFAAEHRRYVQSISRPADDKAADILNSGAILRKKDVGFRYKILIRDGKYPGEVKQNLLRYLTNLDSDIVKISKTGLETLNKSYSYVWNLYLYTNDADIVTFLNLLHPNIVLNIHELVVEADK